VAAAPNLSGETGEYQVSRKLTPTLSIAMACVAVSIPFLEDAGAQTSELVDTTALRVCADPNNLPYSNKAGEGFENKIAELIAKELGVPVHYTWYPQSTGFIRQTLWAKRCDVIIGIPTPHDMVQNTNPYYRSGYFMVYRSDKGITAKTIADPQLKRLRIGVVAGTPPASLLATHGLLDHLRSYHLTVDTRFESPGKQMMDDLDKGAIDVALLWGPIAGFHGKSHNPAYVMVPLPESAGALRLQFSFSMGIRANEPNWKRRLNDLIKSKKAAIDAILLSYGVPRFDDKGQLILP
jgi:quinoprotein dehydrogenase-associated probable ABC transporter substrate-binding protein